MLASVFLTRPHYSLTTSLLSSTKMFQDYLVLSLLQKLDQPFLSRGVAIGVLTVTEVSLILDPLSS